MSHSISVLHYPTEHNYKTVKIPIVAFQNSQENTLKRRWHSGGKYYLAAYVTSFWCADYLSSVLPPQIQSNLCDHRNAAVMSSQQRLLAPGRWFINDINYTWCLNRLLSTLQADLLQKKSNFFSLPPSFFFTAIASILSFSAFKHLIGLTSRFDSDRSEPPISGWYEISNTDLTKSVWRPKVRWIPGGRCAATLKPEEDEASRCCRAALRRWS